MRDHCDPPETAGSIAIGRLVNAEDGHYTVNLAGVLQKGADSVTCRSVVPFGAADIGCEVALSFENGDPRKPIILGKLLRPEQPAGAAPVEVTPEPETEAPVEVEVDGEARRLEITGQEEVVLRCGKASITLTRAGKVLIRGAYISSRSTGMNRIKGGSVHLN